MSTHKSTLLYGEVMGFLAAVREHFSQAADCEITPDGGYLPNEAMALTCSADEAMANLTAMANAFDVEELARIDRILAKMVHA
jgi:hypothetical protein